MEKLKTWYKRNQGEVVMEEFLQQQSNPVANNPSNEVRILILEMPPRRRRREEYSFHPKTCLALAAVGYFATYWIWDWTKDTDLLLGLILIITNIWVWYFVAYGFIYPIFYD